MKRLAVAALSFYALFPTVVAAQAPLSLPSGAFEEFVEVNLPATFTNAVRLPDGSFFGYADVSVQYTHNTKVYQSLDGMVWNLSATLADFSASMVGVGENGVMLSGVSGRAYYSADGVSWVAANLPNGERPESLCAHNGSFYALTNSGYYDNSDLYRWTQGPGWEKVSEIPAKPGSLRRLQGYWYAYGVRTNSSESRPPTLRSADGVTWTVIPELGTVSSVFESEGKVIADAFESSDSGATWSHLRKIYSELVSGGWQIKPSGGHWQSGVTFYNPDRGIQVEKRPSSPTVAVIPIPEGVIIFAGAKLFLSRAAVSAPSFAIQPLNQIIGLGNTFSLSAMAIGGQISYQWYEGESGDTSRPLPASQREKLIELRRHMKIWCRAANSFGTADSETASIMASVNAYGSLSYETLQAQELTVIASTDLPLDGVRWTKNGLPVPAGRSMLLMRAAISLEDAGSYRVTVFADGRAYTSEPTSVCVVRRTMSIGSVTPEGSRTKLRQIAAGPGLQYYWTREDRELNEEPGRVEGVNSATLSLNKILPQDEGWYICYVRQTDAGGNVFGELVGSRHYVTVEPLPQIDDFELPDVAMVSRSMNIQPLTRNLVTRYEVKNLPPGMKFNTRTGVTSGSPSRAGTFTFTVRGINSAGPGPWKSITLTVEPMPAVLVGTFNGLVGRVIGTGEGKGGACSVSITSVGTTTGFVDVGSNRYPFSGRLECATSGSNCLTVNLANGYVTLQLSHDASTSSMIGTVAASDGSWAQPFLAKKLGLSAATATWAGKTTVDLAPLATIPGTPSGRGTGLVSVTTNGAYTWAGKLADGAAYAMAGRLTPDGQFAARTLLYDKKGSLQGWQKVDDLTMKPSGTLEWMKYAIPGAKSFPAGFPLHTLGVNPEG